MPCVIFASFPYIISSLPNQSRRAANSFSQIGTSSPSVSQHIADVQKLIASSGVKYSMHSAGTTLEGSWEEVMDVVGKAHTLLHDNGVVRVQTDIRIGTRTDKVQSMEDKVTIVEKLLNENKPE